MMGFKERIDSLTSGWNICYLIEFLLLGGFLIYVGVKIVIFCFEGGPNIMLIPAILVLIIGFAIFGGFVYGIRRKCKE